MKDVEIRTFGGFSLSCGDATLVDTQTRSRKIWSLLAYLIQHRDTAFSGQRLMELFWGDDSDSANPENALRVTLHRLRSMLDRLWPGAGRELILCRDGCYCWNPSAPIFLDSEAFEILCDPGRDRGGERLERLLEALALYRGPFLPRQSSELWVVPHASHFANLFLTVSMEAAQLLSQQGRHPEAVAVCRAAADQEPYHEALHGILIRELAAAGDPRGAAEVYNTLSRRLSEEFGILPGEELQTVYRGISGTPEILPMEEVLGHLQENPDHRGAMQCSYEHFKVLCHIKSRSLDRTGGIAHVALLHIVSGSDQPLSSRSLKRIMELFGQTLRENLRLGDVISRCSSSQYIILLPDANYENSCMVCNRVAAAFRCGHPHICADIHFIVQPLSPHIRIP